MTMPNDETSAGELSELAAQAGVRCELATGKQQNDALSLLLTGRVSSGGPAVEQFRSFADQHHLALDHTWMAVTDSGPVASMLVVPSAGKTAMAFLSPIKDAEHGDVVAVLAHTACLSLARHGLHLVQILLEPQQSHEVAALTRAGFTHLANLLYMERKTHLKPCPLELDGEIKVHHWDEAHRDMFATSILASYQDTMDCPGLLGLRHIDDIIAGHLSTGEFDPRLWFNLSHDGDPVGVMLLNKVPQRQALELVYLGLHPKWRSRGLSRKLVEHGVGLAPRHHMDCVLLAVDANNAPALRLYRGAHFVENGRKVAMIFTLNESE